MGDLFLVGKEAVKKWKTHLPIDYIDTSLTINTYEVVSSNLGEGKLTRLWRILVVQTNNGATAETIVLELTVDGAIYEITLTNATSGITYYLRADYDLASGKFTFGFSPTAYVVGDNLSGALAKPFIATIGLVRVKQTSTVDVTSAQIEVNIGYDTLEEVV